MNRTARPRLRTRILTVATVAASTVAGLLAVAPGSTAAPAHPGLPAGTPGAPAAACAKPAAGHAACTAQFVVPTTEEKTAPTIRGYAPADIASAYSLTGNGHGVVAIVDAFDNPRAEANLAVYRKHWKLPACTTANGCFRKVNQEGDASPLPDGDPGWGLEIALDLDAVSASCPLCSILLVEGDDNSLLSLGKAVNTAVALGADVVSNSYSTDGEFAQMARLGAKYYDHPGVPILASTGDFGFGPAGFPAVTSKVIAVGGTTLKRDDSARGWSETAWSLAGSGCSAYIPKPAFQAGTGTHCTMRLTGDVSAVADSRTGLAVYDTYGTSSITSTGWIRVGGTSLSTPLVAGMVARAGHAASYDDASGIYARAASFHDVVGGRNGFCGGDYLCTAVTGYDGPTGVGTPNGLGGL